MTLVGAASSLARALPPSRTKVRVGRVIGLAATKLGAQALVDMTTDNGRFLLDARSRTEAGKLWNGFYDEDDLAFLRAITPTNGTFLDIGANIGLILIPLAHHLTDGRIIGVEPVPVNVARLRDAVSLNTAIGATEIHAVALGRQRGSLSLAKEGHASSSGNAVPTHAADPHATVVELTTLDDLAATLALHRLDTIKIDVEGFEVDVFAGARQTLTTRRPTVYGEFNNELMPTHGSSFLDAWAIFQPLGYECFSFIDRMSLLHQPSPSPTLGNVVLVPQERVEALATQGVRVTRRDP
jgi:FkbM family methyltransferase